MAQNEYRSSLALASKYASTGIRVSALGHCPELRHFDAWATLTVQTGDCSTQTYATPAELRRLAAMLTEAADVIDAHAAQQQQVVEAA